MVEVHPTSAEDAGGCRRSVIDMVNPKFNNFSKPFLLAISVGLLTLIVVVYLAFHVIFKEDEVQTQATTSCTDAISYPQYFGGYASQREFIGQTRFADSRLAGTKTSENVVTETTVDICVNVNYAVQLLWGSGKWHFGLSLKLTLRTQVPCMVDCRYRQALKHQQEFRQRLALIRITTHLFPTQKEGQSSMAGIWAIVGEPQY